MTEYKPDRKIHYTVQQFMNAVSQLGQITGVLHSTGIIQCELNDTGPQSRSLHKATEAYLHAKSKPFYSR